MTLKDIAKQKGLHFTDHVKFNSFDTKEASTGKTYGVGRVTDLFGESHSIKVWDSSVVANLVDAMKQGTVVIFKVSGVTDVYQGAFSLTIHSLANADATITVEQFLNTEYKVQDLMARAGQIYKTEVSEKGQQVIKAILTGETAARFVEEFAASVVHDARRHGLLAHTTKMLEIGKLIHTQHKEMLRTQDEIDLFYIGLLFHDIGKTVEYAYGTRTNLAFVSHQVLGVEFIKTHEKLIESHYGTDWYYHLVAVLTQHHGTWGLRPQSTMSYLVHLVDVFETQVSIYTEKFTESQETGKMQIYDNSERLNLVYPQL